MVDMKLTRHRMKEKNKLEITTYDPKVHGEISIFSEKNIQEVERYWVDEPYAFASILYDNECKSHVYHVVEPKLTKFEKVILEDAHERLRDTLVIEDVGKDIDKTEILAEKVKEILSRYIGIDTVSFHKILYYIKTNYLQFGRLNAMMSDKYLEDTWCNGVGIPIFVYHKGYGILPSNIVFEEEAELNSFVIRLAQQGGKEISTSNPFVDASMKGGSRIQITFGRDIGTRGSSFSIRNFSTDPLTPIDLVAWGTYSIEMMAYLWITTESKKSMIIAGGTASGKTTSLNAISLFIPSNSRIISLEDTREIQLAHDNWIPYVARDTFTGGKKDAIDLYDLLTSSLRQRPEYLIVGEVRGVEAQVLFQAMNTGHTTFSTLHAGSISAVVNRLTNEPINIPIAMFQALDFVSIQASVYELGKESRRVERIIEIVDIQNDRIKTNDVFVWDPLSDKFVFKKSYLLDDIMKRRGWDSLKLKDELNRRQDILKFMIDNGVRDYRSVFSIINSYYKDPDKVLDRIGIKND